MKKKLYHASWDLDGSFEIYEADKDRRPHGYLVGPDTLANVKKEIASAMREASHQLKDAAKEVRSAKGES